MVHSSADYHNNLYFCDVSDNSVSSALALISYLSLNSCTQDKDFISAVFFLIFLIKKMIISALTSKAACFCHGFSLLQKRILLSYCIYIFTLSTNGSSLSISPLQSVFTTSRTSSFCAYCSKSSLTYSGSHDIDISSNSISAATPNKITSIEPNQDLLGVPTAPYGGSSNLPKGYHSARVLLVGDGDLSFAAALSTLKVCKRLVASLLITS